MAATGRPPVHGECVRGRLTPEYRAWASMKRRCEPGTHKYSANYYHRGITVCDEWKTDYMAFLNHVGRKPSPTHSLDRIDNNLGYAPGNVRWATASQQTNNRRMGKLAARDVRMVRMWIWLGHTDVSIAAAHGITGETVRCIRIGKSWANA